MCGRGRKYRVQATATRALVGLVAALVIGVASGCSGFAEQTPQPPDGQDQGDAHQVAADLYESMVVVFHEDTEGIEFSSPDRFLVVSVYEAVADERRRRFVGQVVPVGRGIGVEITAEYQQESADDDGKWVDEPREEVQEEASPDELRMARRVERVYNRGDF